MNPNSALIEEGDPALDARAFRRCLGQFATGVTVMTASHDKQLAGMSANSFAALSLDPPLVLWCIRRQSGSLPVFRQASHFAVNVLSSEQVEVSNLFAAPNGDKFGRTRWAPGQHGAPLLEGAIACLECRLEQILEGGDHFIIVGKVEHYARFSGEPLLFTQGRYAVTQEHPDAIQEASNKTSPQSAFSLDAAQGSLMRLLHYTSHQMSTQFVEQREAEGLTIAQFRTYGWLRTQPRTLDQLKQLTYLGGWNTEDTVAGLLDRGHILMDKAGVLHLTQAGRERADASARRVAAFEANLLQGISNAEIATARRVLAAICSAHNGSMMEAQI